MQDKQVREGLLFSELWRQLRLHMTSPHPDKQHLFSLNPSRLPPAELQRLLAIAVGAEGIQKWLILEPTLPVYYQGTQLDEMRRELIPFDIMVWLAGGTPYPKSLPPAVALVWLQHIITSLGGVV